MLCSSDCIATASINSFTSIFSGLVVFSYLGYMAKTRDMDIADMDGMGEAI